MNKISLIIRREYLHKVQKKSFILLTFLTPFLFAALIFVPLWLSSIKGDETYQIAVIDTTGKYAPLFQDTENFHFIKGDKSLDEYKESTDREIFAFLNITDDLLQTPNAATLYSSKQIPGDLSRLINQVLSKQLEQDKLASFNIPNLNEIIKESQINYAIQTVKWGDDGSETASSAEIASIIGIIFTMIIYMFILIYGAMVMQGVLEEKTNRIIEIMISSVKPFDLMMGKIIGIGLVGLTQMFLWGVMTFALIAGGSLLLDNNIDQAALQSSMAIGNPAMNLAAQNAAQPSGNEIFTWLQAINISEIVFLFILYFIGGYMLYAAIFAAIGSAVDNQEDTQQFVAPVTIFMVFALYAGIYSAENPDGPLAFWGSFIPFTSPIVMMVRLPFEVPLWEKALSIILLYASFIGIIWVSAKIYRVGILMYGKKISLKEMTKWFRYK